MQTRPRRIIPLRRPASDALPAQDCAPAVGAARARLQATFASFYNALFDAACVANDEQRHEHTIELLRAVKAQESAIIAGICADVARSADPGEAPEARWLARALAQHCAALPLEPGELALLQAACAEQMLAPEERPRTASAAPVAAGERDSAARLVARLRAVGLELEPGITTDGADCGAAGTDRSRTGARRGGAGAPRTDRTARSHTGPGRSGSGRSVGGVPRAHQQGDPAAGSGRLARPAAARSESRLRRGARDAAGGGPAAARRRAGPGARGLRARYRAGAGGRTTASSGTCARGARGRRADRACADRGRRGTRPGGAACRRRATRNPGGLPAATRRRRARGAAPRGAVCRQRRGELRRRAGDRCAERRGTAGPGTHRRGLRRACAGRAAARRPGVRAAIAGTRTHGAARIRRTAATRAGDNQRTAWPDASRASSVPRRPRPAPRARA